MRIILIACVLASCLAACANKRIDELPSSDAGQVFKTRFGTIISQHPVTIRSSPQTAISTGVFAAGVTSTLIAADHVTFVGGALAGGAAAAAIHYFGEIDNAIEYQVMLDDGSVVLLEQLQASDERIFLAGEPVLVEFGAMKNRVLPLPDAPSVMPPPRQISMDGKKKGVKKLDMQICSKTNVGDGTREACVKF